MTREGATGNRLKLLILIDSLGLGGAESLLIPFARAAGQAEVDVQIVALEGPSGPNAMVDAIRSVGIEPGFLGVHRLLLPDAIPRIAAYIRSSGCDVVHAHLGYSITLGVPAARLARRPIVCTFHHIPGPLSRSESIKERLSVAAASRSARCIFVSDAQRDAFVGRYRLLREGWTVIRNGVDLSEFERPPIAFPPELRIPDGAPVVTMAAALRGAKGHGAAIVAWELVRRQVPDARLLLVGSGPEGDRLRRQVSEGALGDSVIFAGFRRDVPALLGSSTLVLSASETEALPTVLMEAAAAGVPVIATSVGGTTELVEDGVTGVLVPPRRPDRLSAAIVDLLGDPGARAGMAAEAKQRAAADFGSDRWVERLRKVYTEAISVRRSVSAGYG